MTERAPVIIPARAGSKGIPNKNIMNLCGKPLIAWTIESALKSEHVSKVYVSTDGEDIADISRKYGAEIIWRPAGIASDYSSSEEALIHALPEMEAESDFENLIFLQATSPLREKNDIDNAYAEFVGTKFDSMFSAAVMDDFTLWEGTPGKEMKSLNFDFLNRGRRQDRQPVYLENGSIYIFRKEILKKSGNRLGGNIGIYIMPFNRSIEIDSVADVSICSAYLNEMIKKGEI